MSKDIISPRINAPAYQSAANVTPSDSVDLAGGVTSALFIGGAGTLKVTMADGTTPTFTFPAGFAIELCVTRIWLTGTTATLVVALY
ncbi:MAG: hypothetical protein WC762_03090 [Methylobacter sp.]|jgi:hypothetical protein